MKLTHHSQATTKAGTGKPAKTQGRRANTTLEKKQTLILTKLHCLPAPQKTSQEASNKKKRKEENI